MTIRPDPGLRGRPIGNEGNAHMSGDAAQDRIPTVSPGSPHIRCTVVRVDKPRSAMRVGDWFEIQGSRLVIPAGKSISPDAFAAVATVVVLRQMDLPGDNWFVRKPFICGPDAEENIVLKVEAIPPEAGR
jgi:uncharacterized repeat protein (TIGR04076 family)